MISASVVGREMIELAKMIGITPDIATLIGIRKESFSLIAARYNIGDFKNSFIFRYS